MRNKAKTTKKLLAAPYILWMLLFTVIPLALVIYFSLTTTDGKFTFDNLKNKGYRSEECNMYGKDYFCQNPRC